MVAGEPPAKKAKKDPKEESESESEAEEAEEEKKPARKQVKPPLKRKSARSSAVSQEDIAKPTKLQSDPKDASTLKEETENQFLRTIGVKLACDQSCSSDNKSGLKSDFRGVRPNLSHIFMLFIERVISIRVSALDNGAHHLVNGGRYDEDLMLWAMIGELTYFLYYRWSTHQSVALETRVALKLPCDIAAMIQSLGECVIDGQPSLIVDYPWWMSRVIPSARVQSMLGKYAGRPFSDVALRSEYLHLSETIAKKVRYMSVEVAYANPLPSILGVGIYSSSVAAPTRDQALETLGAVSCITRRTLVASEVLMAAMLRLWTVEVNGRSGVYSPVLTVHPEVNDVLRSHLTSSAWQASVDGHILKAIFTDAFVASSVTFK